MARRTTGGERPAIEEEGYCQDGAGSAWPKVAVAQCWARVPRGDATAVYPAAMLRSPGFNLSA